MQPALDRDNVTIYQGDCREVLDDMHAESVQMCVTSPPYYQLRDYGHDSQIGLESSLGEFIDTLVSVFEKVKRVLRPDGTLWLNMGDTSSSSGNQKSDRKEKTPGWRQESNFKRKEILGVPWRLAFALQDAGWYLRQDIIWHKRSPMPESCVDRCTKAHEYIFLLSKQPDYYFDNEAIKEPASENTHSRGNNRVNKIGERNTGVKNNDSFRNSVVDFVETRNKRSVWSLSSEPFPGAHFAVFPTKLIEPCILAGTSEDGCCSECGAPRARQIEKQRKATRPGSKSKVNAVAHQESPNANQAVGNRDPQRHTTVTKTTGWKAGCDCNAPTTPCVVLDPFLGSGTTCKVSQDLGRCSIGIEASEKYVEIAIERFQQKVLF